MASGDSSSSPAPPLAVLLAVKTAVAAALSFGFGREPGTMPKDPMAELCLPVIAICVFLVYYNLVDTLEVGKLKWKHGVTKLTVAEASKAQIHEEVLLAHRAQQNQLEQLPPFLASTLCFAVFVNGVVAGVLACAWVCLRMQYSATYRRAVGKSFQDSGLAKYTVPCYLILNPMSVATAIHMLRYALQLTF